MDGWCNARCKQARGREARRRERVTWGGGRKGSGMGQGGPECAVRLGWSCIADPLGHLGHGGLGPKPSERKEDFPILFGFYLNRIDSNSNNF
jgi:hypothetical protein